MSGPSAGEVIFYLLLLILPLSALLSRRIAWRSALKFVLAWVAIFVVGLLIAGQSDRLRPAIADAKAALFGSNQIVTGGTVRIAKAADGHFYADATINGVARRMLIDSGATTTALSSATARAAGIDLNESPFPVFLSTANGQVEARSGTVAELRLGTIAANGLPVVVAENFGDSDVIGMNFLSRLHGWRVEGQTLVLEPEPT